MGDFGRRWSAHQSDIDSDYRRELATSGGGILHQEARARDGGSSSILVRLVSPGFQLFMSLILLIIFNNIGLVRSCIWI